MASKKYAFYHKGNKLALTQQQQGGSLTFTDSSGNVITRGSSTSDVSHEYKSPMTDVDHGLEIEYSYAPVWNETGNETGLHSATSNSAGYEYFGWSSVGGKLAFHLNPGTDYTSADYDEELGADASGSNLLIKGPSIWAGIHEINARGATGIITTNTKVNLGTRQRLATAKVTLNEATDGSGNRTILEDDTGSGAFIRMFPVIGSTYYFYSALSGTNNNKIIYEVQRLNNKQLSVIANWAFTAYSNSAGGWTRTTPTNTIPNDIAEAEITMQQIFKDDNCILFGKNHFSVMEDESFELDLTRTQSEALIYFVKARLAEDMEDFEKREYFMRLFKKSLGKSNGNKSPGAYLAQGHWHMK